MPRSRVRIAAAATAGAVTLALILSGCDSFIGPNPLDPVSSTPTGTATSTSGASTPKPTATVAEPVFTSEFSDLGSVHIDTKLNTNLTLRLTMWTIQKTHTWTATSDKQFSFVIDVLDSNVPADAAFKFKRRVYSDRIQVTGTTTTKSGAIQTPLYLDLDPIKTTLDPEALHSKRGLLITSPKGGYTLENNEIGKLASDTYGLTVDFGVSLYNEKEYSSGKYASHVVHISVPVSIFSQATADAASVDSSTVAPTNN